MIVVFALDRNDQGEWLMANYSACQGQALTDIGMHGAVMGVPIAAISAIKSKLVQEESVDRIKNASIDAATRVGESLISRLPHIFGRRAQ